MESQAKVKIGATEDKRQFMKGKSSIICFDIRIDLIADVVDPLKKREEFAVSLRKEKKTALIRNKRLRLMANQRSQVGAQQ